MVTGWWESQQHLQVVGTRFHYQLYRGSGPSSGWISSKIKGKQLVVPADVRDTGKRLETKAPIPELLYVHGSQKHGTLREVQGGVLLLDKSKQRAGILNQSKGLEGYLKSCGSNIFQRP